MGKIEEDDGEFEAVQEKLDVGLRAVHGSHDEREERGKQVGGGLGADRKAFDSRNGDGDEGDEMWEAIEMLQFGQCFGRDEEGDSVASLS